MCCNVKQGLEVEVKKQVRYEEDRVNPNAGEEEDGEVDVVSVVRQEEGAPQTFWRFQKLKLHEIADLEECWYGNRDEEKTCHNALDRVPSCYLLVVSRDCDCYTPLNGLFSWVLSVSKSSAFKGAGGHFFCFL